MILFSIINIIDDLMATPVGFEPARQRYIAGQKPNAIPTELSEFSFLSLKNEFKTRNACL